MIKPQGLQLSVVIIAKNEADRIGDAIRSVDFADEVVVLDSGSTDTTVAIARDLGARVIETDWPGFVAQKNRAWQEALGEWVLSMDADERVSSELAGAIRGVVEGAPQAEAFEVSRRNIWLGIPLSGGGWYPDRRVRLARKASAHWVGENPHDRLVARGAVLRLSGDLIHIPYRNLGEHLSTIDRYTQIAAQELVAHNRVGGGIDLFFRPLWRFFSAYVLKGGFRDGAAGLVLAILHALYGALKYARAQKRI